LEDAPALVVPDGITVLEPEMDPLPLPLPLPLPSLPFLTIFIVASTGGDRGGVGKPVSLSIFETGSSCFSPSGPSTKDLPFWDSGSEEAGDTEPGETTGE